MNLTKRAGGLFAILTFAIAATVYLLTLTPTVPFWDSGEFIAVSQILGIPHPPGTPFYVLLGRIATLVPWASIAQRVNALSALSGALAVVFTYLSILKMVRISQGGERKPWQEWVAIGAAVIGALMLAFSDVFWENSIEAEVYQLMSLAQILVFWLGLKWWEAHDQKPSVSYLLVATYVMWLCVGLHLGVGIMGLPLIVLVWMVDKKVALLFAMPFLSLLRVPAGLEKMMGAVIALSTLYALYMTWKKKLPGWVAILGMGLAVPGLRASFSDANLTPLTAVLTVIAVVGPMAFLARTQREGRVLLLALFLMIAGYSTHLYLPIRAAQHPGINEGAPATWSKMRDLLERKQYGEMKMSDRRGMTSYDEIFQVQVNKEFWRYFARQWPIFPTDKLWGILLPLALGLAGGVWQFMRDKKGFAISFVFLGLSTVGMIVFLNFSSHEVRDRDYFFQSGFHAFALWMGLGVAWLVSWIRESFAEGQTQNLATYGSLALLALQPALLAKNLWFTHDRSGNYIARDYAYNMLAPLEPNSYVFTNGDNDTFPLWYLQQVEGIGKGVRVVNLSLLNTDWYIRQLRDEEPKVPVTISDQAIEALGSGMYMITPGLEGDSTYTAVYRSHQAEGWAISRDGIVVKPDEKGSYEPIYTNEFMVHHLLDKSRGPNGTWLKQPYLAVTVPEHYGYDSAFSLKGLVYKVERDTTKAGLDVVATHKALYETFKYRGLFNPDGSWDSKVYKDDNASTLSRNYASAHLQLAFHYRDTGEMQKAVTEMERVGRMFPDYAEVQIPLGGFYMQMGDTGRALALYERLAKSSPNSPEVRYYHGASLAFKGRAAEAVREFDAAIELDPRYALPYYGAYTTLREIGERERALGYLQRWLQVNPGDSRASQLFESERQAMGLGTPQLGRPPIPQLR
ncbi:MAG: DUF2723 domain-containing protein [Candidatus Eisenbacteria bacterium]